MFAKLIHGYLITAKENLPSKEAYIAAGYKEVEFTPEPQKETGYRNVVGWEETEETIVQTWTLVKDPDDVDPADAFEFLFGGGAE